MASDKLDTVRKLLTKADGAATAHEAAAYTEKAVELMARHGIDAALLAAADPGRDEIGGTRLAVGDPYSAGKARLLAWTASAMRCRAVLHEARSGRVEAVTVFGFASDRERVEVLYTSLLLQAAGQLVRQRPTRPGESVAAYRRSWLHGFAVEVHRRLVAAERRATGEKATEEKAAEEKAAGPGAGSSPAADASAREHGVLALVLADRVERVERAYAEAFPTLGRARRSTLSGSGCAAGAAAGERADLAHAAVPAARQRAVGA